MTTNNNILLTGEERDAYIAKRFPNKLTGQALLDYVDANNTLSRVELCTGAGHLKDTAAGQGCDFISFYEAILDARKANGEYQESQQQFGAYWYECLTVQDQDLYDMIEDMCPEFTKLDAEQCQEFMDELSEHGITTAEQFQDAYFYQTGNWNAECEFAEYVTTELSCVDLPHYVVIDWQATWDRALRYDFFTIEFDGETYFFSSNF